MNNFTFDKKDRQLLQMDINGKVYTLNPYTLAVKKASMKFVKCQQPLIDRIQKKPTDKELDRIIMQSCSLVRDTLNQMLGKGAYDKIFAGRTLDFDEHQKIIEFIFNEIAEFCKQHPILENHESIA